MKFDRFWQNFVKFQKSNFVKPRQPISKPWQSLKNENHIQNKNLTSQSTVFTFWTPCRISKWLVHILRSEVGSFRIDLIFLRILNLLLYLCTRNPKTGVRKLFHALFPFDHHYFTFLVQLHFNWNLQFEMVEGETFPRVESNFTELKNVKVVFCESILCISHELLWSDRKLLRQTVLVSLSKHSQPKIHYNFTVYVTFIIFHFVYSSRTKFVYPPRFKIATSVSARLRF